MSVFNLSLQTISPVHIGDGNELRQDFDFVVRGGRTYRLDEDAILAALQDRLVPGRDGRYPLPGKLIDDASFGNPDLFRYSLRGFPRSAKTDARIKSFIKDVHDRPYIPGSSLKGAFRTALAWAGWPEIRPALDRSAIGRNKSWAGQLLERKLFGPDPNHDLLRALQVSDLHGPEKAGEGLLLANAQVLTRRSAGSPIELEALSGDIAFHGSLVIDDSLFAPHADRQLHFSKRKGWLDELPVRAQAHSRARIQMLLEWYEAAEGAETIARFYRQLAALKPGPHQALMQIGWGAGWDGKTFWTHLLAETQLFERLVQDFRLHRAGKNSPPRRPGDPFPRSRRVAITVKDGVPRPAAPFGWVLVEMHAK